jgi:CrcB protein
VEGSIEKSCPCRGQSLFEKILIVSLGAALGANARYWLGAWIGGKYGATFPWGTLVVNLTGCFLIGLYLALAIRFAWSPSWRLFVVMGVLGGYTTFSSFGYEAFALLVQGRYERAFLYTTGSVVLGLIGVWLGTVAARLVIYLRDVIHLW